MKNSKKKLLVLPVDGRPAVRKQLESLASLADWEVLLPPISMLGYFREAADLEQIDAWIEQYANSVDGFVLSLDTLVYGGLVASRICTDSSAHLLGRCQMVKSIKRRHADKPIFGFLSTMRISNNNVNEEEKDYWGTYGEAIWAWSYYSDKFQVQGDIGDLKTARAAQSAIPCAVKTDYLETRKRNARITAAILELVADGTIDRLVLPQDDNASYGFNIAEMRALQQTIAAKKIQHSVLIYSGADEVAWTLISALISLLEQRRSRQVFLDWHHPEDATELIPRYENCSVGSAVQSQILAAGATLSNSLADADIVLAIHTGHKAQGDWALNIPIEQDEAETLSWTEGLRKYQYRGLPVAIADLAYANGGDPGFFHPAIEWLDFEKIVAYGAWNTTSNSLGSIAAQMQLLPLEWQSQSVTELTLTRFVDDAFYQGYYRQVLRQDLRSKRTNLDAGKAAFRNAANQWLADHFASSASIENVYFPWGRSFEIGFDLRFSNPLAIQQRAN